ncbi:MAG: T9SS type A sorting domain-containing protein [Lentimicrobium sp.]|nr:T9SS type A sorting domain-containing protein [Lentimicrobium sp.]
MKIAANIIVIVFLCFSVVNAQEYATFQITGTHQGNGSFNNAALSGFNWTVNGSLTGEVQILNNEVFDDGNAFENTFGQADNAQNLRIQVEMNGSGTLGQPLTSRATMTLLFDEITPSNDWGFCVVDIDVENCLFSAIDENDIQVPMEVIDGWLVELFDANLSEDGTNLPKWDATNAALLGSDTPEDYVVYNNLVIGDMPSSEAPAAYFMPDIPLKSLTIVFENLQDIYNTSYHFYIASMQATAVDESNKVTIDIFPVPASEIIRVRMPNGSLENSVVTFLNAAGKEMMSRQVSETVSEIEFDVSHLPDGVYFLKFFSNNQLFTRKICKAGR